MLKDVLTSGVCTSDKGKKTKKTKKHKRDCGSHSPAFTVLSLTPFHLSSNKQHVKIHTGGLVERWDHSGSPPTRPSPTQPQLLGFEFQLYQHFRLQAAAGIFSPLAPIPFISIKLQMTIGLGPEWGVIAELEALGQKCQGNTSHRRQSKVNTGTAPLQPQKRLIPWNTHHPPITWHQYLLLFLWPFNLQMLSRVAWWKATSH